MQWAMGKQEGEFSGMESVFSGFVLDPSKCNQLSLEEKRQLVHRIAQWSDDAPKILSSLTRRELLEIICAEMGKERKYSGFTKHRMIEHLLKLVSDTTKTGSSTKLPEASYLPKPDTAVKKRKNLEELAPRPSSVFQETINEEMRTRLCQNLACKATMKPEDSFCKRCSCCICHQFDENKDPTLWLSCDSEFPDEGEACGMSCHLNCAVKHDRAGILKDGFCPKLDGGFYCVCCGKVNRLMRTWRKQLVIAKEARRVDALCLRVSLSHKILEGTEQYKELLEMAESSVKALEKEVGPLDLASAKMDRRLVSRLSCSIQVQKLSTAAVEAFDSMSSSLQSYPKTPPNCQINFEESSPTSVTIVLEYEEDLFEEFLGCRLWHRKSTMKVYPREATYIVLGAQKRFKLSNLDPSTEYLCMISFFSNKRTMGVWESRWVTPMSSKISVSLDADFGEIGDIIKVNTQARTDSVKSSSNKAALGDHLGRENDYSASPTSNFPSTPCKSDGITKMMFHGTKKQVKENDYEYAVGVIRRLEHDGQLSKDFRVKFLTWFSLKATMQERRVVNVFVDTLIDDPPSLAEQLVDTFTDVISSRQERVSVSSNGFCSRLWH